MSLELDCIFVIEFFECFSFLIPWLCKFCFYDVNSIKVVFMGFMYITTKSLKTLSMCFVKKAFTHS